MTAHDWLCGGAVLALTFGALVALIWAEERGGHIHRPGCQTCGLDREEGP